MIDSPMGRMRPLASGVAPVIGSIFSRDLYMLTMLNMINQLRQDEKGAALVEYGLLIGLIAVICAAAVTLLGQEISGAFSFIASSLSAV